MVCNSSSEGVAEKLWVQYDSDRELAAVDLFCNYPEPLLVFASVCCVLYMFIGIPGNLTTIIALARCKKIRNATAIFIINLHISDLIFCSIILPMTAITFAQKHWTHGMIMCHVYPFLKYVLNATSTFTILAISINRYIIVCHPMLYPRLYKIRNISIMLLMLWSSSILIFLPSTFEAWGRLDLDPTRGFCTMIKDKHGRSPRIILVIVCSVGTYFTIILCYAQIWWMVRKTAKKAQGQNVRLTHLPPTHTQSDTQMSNNGKKFISFEASFSENRTAEGDNTRNNSAANSPNEEKPREKFFNAPFRLTKKEVRTKIPTRRDKKLWAMIAAIMISLSIFHLPIMATRILYKEYESEPIANVCALLLEYLGNCMNPIIYVLMSNDYRQAYKSLFIKAVMTKI